MQPKARHTVRERGERAVIAAVFALAALAAIAGDACAQNSPHGKLPFPCEDCHTADDWKFMPTPSKFQHAKTGFALQGQHEAVSCMNCHTDLKFALTGTECADCHQDVHRGELGSTCERCHSPASWLVTDMAQRHVKTRFALIGVHAVANCVQCHPNAATYEFVGTRTDCYGCHRADFEGSKSPNHKSAGFSTDCAQCHQVNASRWGAAFDHSTTAFPLTGAHTAVSCVQCHVGSDFKSASTQCYACHQAQFSSAKSPSHSGFPTECVSCHSTVGWAPSSFDHAKTHFPLAGAHSAVSCQQCHANGAFKGTPTTCYGCHQTQFADTKNPPHTGFSTTCQSCHTLTSWQPASFDHSTTAFPLTGSHVTVGCTSCHVNGVYKGTSTACYTCHQTDFANAKSPPHAGYPTECTTCHTTSAWHPSSFDHAKTGFPLTGAHASVTCADCHQNNVYEGTTTVCYGCHATQFANTKSPSHMGFSNACQTCHTTSAWRPASFDHNTTAFPLTGLHVSVTCVSCHVNGVYAGTSTSCYACHHTDFATASNPAHAGYPTDCTVCHATSGWRPANFDHAKTVFPLTGAHTAVACAGCHQNNVYTGTTTLCYGCHATQFANTANPPHTGFQNTCQTCHTTAAWQPAAFDHSTTSFALTGAHITVACVQCHVNGLYKGTSTSCYACHQGDFTSAKTPSHTGYPTDCVMCHSTLSWHPSAFDHSKTLFPLTGAHVAVACGSCHVNNVYQGTSADCYACHLQDFSNTRTPPHMGFATTCATCHTTSSWQPAAFDHSTTLFPLTGSHLATPCLGCHQDGVYKGKPTVCFTCHRTDFINAKNPSHSGYVTECTTCHGTQSWHPSTFNHSKTIFPLTGVHAEAGCALCHKTSSFKYTPTECYNCHRNDFTGAKNPSHAGYPTACATCHATFGWRPSTFDHSKTAFALTGAHPAVLCSSCHKNNVFAGTPTDCFVCHQADFTNAKVPVHTGFPTQCVTCHSTAAWHPSTFDHGKTLFPLTGFHLSVACVDCHKNGVFAGTTTQCYGCHQADFAGAANPPHAGFSTDCSTCHTTSAWQPATFDHSKTLFPLTGAHVAVACASCHKNNVYAGLSTDCYSCHTTDFAGTTNPPHTGFPTTCITCHTTIAWQPAAFDHSKTLFPLTGAHTTAPCTACHVNNVWAGTPATCAASTCHLDAYNATIPLHSSGGFGTDCQSCHTTTAWRPFTWSLANHGSWFPINSADRHNPPVWANNCTTCHETSSYKDFACIDCHTHNKTTVDQQHQGRANYVYTSAACYSCHPRGRAG